MLDQVLERADQAMAEARDKVNDMRSPPDIDSNLADSISALGVELSVLIRRPTTPVLQVRETGEPTALKALIRDEVYSIAREAARNAYAHAAAEHIEVQLTYDRAGFTLQVTDDGSGFDQSAIRGHSGGRRWGLAGMRERAEKFGGRLSIESGPSTGTQVKLMVPSRVAFGEVGRDESPDELDDEVSQ